MEYNQKGYIFAVNKQTTIQIYNNNAMGRERREDINVRGTILAMTPGEVVRFPSVVKGSYIRHTCSVLKVDENIVCSVHRDGDSFKVIRVK